MTYTNEDLLALADRLDAPAYWFSGSDEGHEGENAAPREAAAAIRVLVSEWRSRTRIGSDASVAVCPICDIAGCHHIRDAERQKPQHGKEVMPNDDNSSHIRPAVSPRLTAGAQAIRDKALDDAAMCCEVEADKCDDAVKWGGAPKYIANCKAAAYAMRDRAAAIRAMKGKPE